MHGTVNDLTGELVIGGIGDNGYLMSQHPQEVLMAKKRRAVNSGVVGILLIFLGWTA